MSSRSRIALSLVILAACVLGAVLVGTIWLHRTSRIVVQGAVIKKDSDVRKESPLVNVEVSVEGASIPIVARSNFLGFFKLTLPFSARPGQTVELHFRHPDYKTIDVPEVIGARLYVVSMTPIPKRKTAPRRPRIKISKVRVRYTTQTEREVNIGSGITVFEVRNKGNVPCNGQKPCSPDGAWKANTASASLDAGHGNLFENARVSCIAGPCPFTTITKDNYSHTGQQISVTALDWSDTTTFLMQGEVFRREIGEAVRYLYPVIFGNSINFSLPPPAQGPCFEAEVNSIETVFPLAPDPILPWADCIVQIGKNLSKRYRCELKPGYEIVSH